MTLVIFTAISWVIVIFFLLLPHRLPSLVNFLLYMGLSIIDINKCTLLYFKYHYFHVSKDKVHFLSYILHRDIMFSFSLLIMVNVFFTAKKMSLKVGIIAFTFILILFLNQLERFLHILTYIKWTMYHELVMISLIICLALAFGYFFQRISLTKDNCDEKHHL